MLKLEENQHLNSIFQVNYTGYEKTLWYEIFYYKMICKFESLHFLIKCIFFFLISKNRIKILKFHFSNKICKLLESYGNFYRKLSAKRDYHDENVFLKADKALSKLNFLFNLKSKRNSAIWRKFNSHLQYYKIDLSYSNKLQKIILNVCEEYKTEREAGRFIFNFLKLLSGILIKVSRNSFIVKFRN